MVSPSGFTSGFFLSFTPYATDNRSVSLYDILATSAGYKFFVNSWTHCIGSQGLTAVSLSYNTSVRYWEMLLRASLITLGKGDGSGTGWGW